MSPTFLFHCLQCPISSNPSPYLHSEVSCSRLKIFRSEFPFWKFLSPKKVFALYCENINQLFSVRTVSYHFSMPSLPPLTTFATQQTQITLLRLNFWKNQFCPETNFLCNSLFNSIKFDFAEVGLPGWKLVVYSTLSTFRQYILPTVSINQRFGKTSFWIS